MHLKKAIYEYIALDSKFYAKKIVREIISLSSTIAAIPERGRISLLCKGSNRRNDGQKLS